MSDDEGFTSSPGSSTEPPDPDDQITFTDENAAEPSQSSSKRTSKKESYNRMKKPKMKWQSSLPKIAID